MTQVNKQSVFSPKQAARRKAAIDAELDAGLFQALSDPTRLRLVACLAKCRRACSVTEVAECCSVDFSVVSRHLSLLAAAGVLHAQKDGRTMYYHMRYEWLSETLRRLAAAIDDCCPPGGSDACNCGCAKS